MVCVADLKKFLAFNRFKQESEEDQMFWSIKRTYDLILGDFQFVFS